MHINKGIIEILFISVLLVSICVIGTSASSSSLRVRRLKSPHLHYSSRSRTTLEEFQAAFPEYTPPPPPPPYTINYYTQTLDHFNFQTQKTFQQRYLISDTYWTKPEGNICNTPILFYAGNEGDIVVFYENSQFITNVLAQELNALLLFAEHRYYGETMPFGNESISVENIGYLTIEQALADYAELIPTVLGEMGISHCPVITLGGSYGGDLSAWFRMKYPNIVDGALASSAPILYFLNTGVNLEGYNHRATVDYTETSSEGTCSERVQSAIKQLAAKGSTPSGLSAISQTFRLCETADNFDDFITWVEYSLTYMAMADYTAPANFLQPLPANPINVSCSAMANSTDDILGLVEMLNIYFNYTGNVQCFNYTEYINSLDDVGMEAWDYQSCTEMVVPITSDGINDMFLPSPFSLDALNQYCQQRWKVTPNPSWMTTFYGGSNFTASNIFFSAGARDPWTAGVVSDVSRNGGPDLVPYLIQSAAHHQDLRYPEPTDSESLQKCRLLEMKYIQYWSNEAAIKKQLK